MYKEYLNLAVTAAERAGELLSRRRDIRVDANEPHDMKLSADKDSESVILDTLAPSGLHVLAEESGSVGDDSRLRWIIDPLDGTVNYFKGMDELTCVSIGLFDGDEPVLGVIYRFAAKELFTGAAGQGAALNGEPIRASNTADLREAVMATGFPSEYEYTAENIKRFADNVRRVKKVRMLGAAAVMAAFTACGRVDMYYEEDVRLWDIAAAAAIVRSAGGAVSLRARPDDRLYRCTFGAFATRELMEAFFGA
jgi:myo-inositol-1(or 4)-monophosphatase